MFKVWGLVSWHRDRNCKYCVLINRWYVCETLECGSVLFRVGAHVSICEYVSVRGVM